MFEPHKGDVLVTHQFPGQFDLGLAEDPDGDLLYHYIGVKGNGIERSMLDGDFFEVFPFLDLGLIRINEANAP